MRTMGTIFQPQFKSIQQQSAARAAPGMQPLVKILERIL
jgi:hypothetical protein